MTITVSENIGAPREDVWRLITDIDSWEDTISGIVGVEVIDRPNSGVVGLKWRETRVMFGKEADETMWITAAEPNRFYETRAESHGSIYTTRLSLDDANENTVLTMQFSAKPTSIAAKMMSAMTFMFSGTLRKMLEKDLADIRQAAENTN